MGRRSSRRPTHRLRPRARTSQTSLSQRARPRTTLHRQRLNSIPSMSSCELSAYNAELHASCDFILKNFDIRQTARDEEIEALKQAKAILSGAKFEEFLQQ